MSFEKIIFDVIASSKSRSQKGDISQALLEQGFFDLGTMPRGLKERHDLPSGGNPVDIKKELKNQGFFEGKNKKNI